MDTQTPLPGYKTSKSGAVLLTSRTTGTTTASSTSTTSKGPWVNWGADNMEPQQLVALVDNNPSKMELITTVARFIAGNGLSITREVMKDGKLTTEDVLVPQDVKQWLRKNKIDAELQKAALHYSFFGNIGTELLLDRMKHVSSIKTIDPCTWRAGKKNKETGLVENYYLCSDWKKPIKEGDEANMSIVHAFDHANPDKHWKAFHHGRIGLPGKPYYDTPNWYGTRKWTQLSNLLPMAHIATMENGISPKFHIQIPNDYYSQYYPNEDPGVVETKILDDMDEWLAGAANSGKSFISRYSTSFNEKPTNGWIITAINAESGDTATTERFNQSNVAQMTGHGIAPSLAGVETAGKLSSGSEMRLAYNIYLALKTSSPREVLLQPLEIVRDLNGWPQDWIFGIKNMSLTTLDAGTDGMKPVQIA